MDNEKREALALRLLTSGALGREPGGAPPLRWRGEAALAEEGLRRLLAAELAAVVREHYSAAEALAGGPWAEETARLLDLPAAGAEWPDRTVLVCGCTGELAAYLDRLEALRRAGGSPAAAVILNGREEEVRVRMDRADVRCHWLTDLESVGAAALQSGVLDLEEYCLLLPGDRL